MTLKKLIIPAMLSLAVLSTLAAPADARNRRRRDYSGYRYSSRYDGYGYGGSSRGRVAERAERLYRSGRLSRSHYERTMDKLERGGGPGWTSQVDNTLGKWSRSDRRRR
jgi:hypothetical protein